MPTRSLFLETILCLLVMALAAGAQGTPSGRQWKTSVPFKFFVGTTAMPAGDYTIMSDSLTGVIVFRNESTGHIVLRFTRNVVVQQTVENSELKFMMVGGKHVLHQVWIQGDMHGHDVLHGEDVPEMPGQ